MVHCLLSTVSLNLACYREKVVLLLLLKRKLPQQSSLVISCKQYFLLANDHCYQQELKGISFSPAFTVHLHPRISLWAAFLVFLQTCNVSEIMTDDCTCLHMYHTPCSAIEACCVGNWDLWMSFCCMALRRYNRWSSWSIYVSLKNGPILFLVLSIGFTHAYCMKIQTSISIHPPASSQYVLCRM